VSPIVCLITDRRRAGGEARLIARVADAARGGVNLIQIRERDLDGGPLLTLVERCLEAVRSTRTRIVVNDRLDVALAAVAHGVHLRGDSMPAARVRAVTPPGFLVGRSVHGVDEARQATAAGGLDYLVFGPVFPTASKPGHPGVGVQALTTVVRATPVPVLAIGGITPDTMTQVLDAGAAGVAGIGLFDTFSTVP
jgi:thiamine-phosphate pyrophosphorylase